MTPQLRRLILIGSVIAILFGVADLAIGHVASGVFLATLGALTLVAVLRRWRDERRDVKAVTSFQVIKAYSFFGICVLGGIALFLLAVVGAVREPVLQGSLGLVAAGIGAYVLVKGTINRTR
jgi:hypothetical protein